LAAKRKKYKPLRDRTFLISESKAQYRIFLLLSAGSAALLYLKTLCPTVVPADSGELITACYTLGIAHWPGYPLYVILGNIFINLFNVPDPAYVINLMSAFFGILTVGLLYAIIYHFIRIPFLSASVALLFAWGQTFWSQAIIAEVYTLHTFMVALILFLFTLWLERKAISTLYLIPFFIGLACTNHQLAILVLPAFIYMLFIFEPKPGYERYTSTSYLILWLVLFIISISLPGWMRYSVIVAIGLFAWVCLHQKDRGWKYWLKAFGCFAGGLLLYLYLPIRALQTPIHNWGNPDDLATFISAVLAPSTSQSPGGNILTDLNYLFNPFPALTRNFWPWSKGLWMFEFLSPIFFVFGIWGIYIGLKTGWRMARAFLLFILLNIIVILLVSQPGAEEIFKVDVYYLQSFLVFSVFIAVGMKEWLLLFGTAFNLKNHRVFVVLLILIILMAPLVQLYMNYPKVDKSHNTNAYDFGVNMISGVDNPAKSILLVNKDDLFILWYFDRVLYYHPMPVYPLIPLPGMPRVEDFWLGWYNKELADEDPPRVLFPLPNAGKKWLTPEDELNAFINANEMKGKDIYFTSYGLWDLNIDLNRITRPIRPYKSVFKIMTPDEMNNQEFIIRKNLAYWKSVFKEQAGKLGGFTESPGRNPREDFMFYRYATNLYFHARWAEEKNMPEEGVEFCRMAIDIDPYRVETNDLIAHLLMQLGNVTETEMYILELLRMYPDNANFHYTAATFYNTRGNDKKALDECDIVLRLDPGHQLAKRLKTQIEQMIN